MKINRELLCRYMDRYDLNRVKDYICTECRDELDRQTAVAQMLQKQQFVFLDVWDMEPCDTTYSLPVMAWDQTPNQDPEWIYMLNRHGFLPKLLWAYWDTGETAFIDKLKYYIFHWMEQNPLDCINRETLRTIDMGIRCMNWMSVLLPLVQEGFLEERERDRILQSMEAQFEYLKDHYLERYTLSNWGLLQTTAILRALLLMDESGECVRLKDWAMNELLRQLKLQVLEDGSHWEQSLMYHVEVLNACMELWATFLGTGIAVDERLPTAVWNMAYYLLYAIAPDRTQINQGDSDISSLRDVMVKAAVLFGHGGFKYCGYEQADLSTVWMLGAGAIEKYRELNACPPSGRHGIFPESGNFFIRSGWQEDDSYTYLHNGSLGSSHGHADLTHLTVYYKGKPCLTDNGRYTYREDVDLRVYLKSAFSHNVCVVDQTPMCRPSASWSYEAFASPEKSYLKDAGDAVLCEMAYVGETTEGKNCHVKRSVVIIHPDIWLIADEIRCDGTHSHTAYYHLHKEWSVDLYSEHSAKLRCGHSALRLSGNYVFQAVSRPGSDTYNQFTSHLCLEGSSAPWHNQGRGVVCLCREELKVQEGQVFPCGSQIPASKDQALVIELCGDQGVEYSIILFQEEIWKGVKLYEYQGVPIHGKVIVMKAQGDTFTVIRLKT